MTGVLCRQTVVQIQIPWLKGDAQVGAEEIGRGQSAGMEQGSVEHPGRPEWIHPNGITFLWSCYISNSGNAYRDSFRGRRIKFALSIMNVQDLKSVLSLFLSRPHSEP